MAPAIWYATNELLQLKQSRKLLIVITDGGPDDEATTRDVMDRCSRSDFDLLGVGIQTNSVKRLFPKSIVIRDLSELRQALFNSMQQTLLASTLTKQPAR